MQTRLTKTGRNDPCPCGSGRKYKQCCQQKDEAQQARKPLASLSTQSLIKDALEHHRAGRLPQAAAIYQQVLQSEPDNPDALHLLGLIAQDAGQLDTAVELIRRASSIKPSAPLYYNLGFALQTQGELDAAAESYRKAIALNPNDARVHGNLGAVLQAQGNLDAAIESYRRAIALDPSDAGAHSNLGIALEAQGDVDAAIENYRLSLALNSNEAKTYNNLGNALRNRGEFDAAVDSLRQAIALKPDYAEAHNNLGNALKDLGELDNALACFHSALAIKPDYLEVPWNESLTLLTQGRLAEGWAKYDWRLRQKEHLADYRNLPALRPMYAGEELAGKTILIWAEQGVGDEIMFASVLPDVIRAAGHCVIECDGRLVPLYARSFPAAEIIPKRFPPHPRTQQSDIEWQCPVASLPRFFRPRIESFPHHRGFLVPDATRVTFWKQRFATLGSTPRIGITWRSRRQSSSRNLHYTELRQWGPIFKVPGLTFINVQYDECRAELDAAREEFGVEIHTWDDIDQMLELDEVAAMMRALDLVIAPSTAAQVLASAVGVSVWLLMSWNLNWERLGTEFLPLFPDTCPMWQHPNVAWDAVLESVAAKLRDEFARR